MKCIANKQLDEEGNEIWLWVYDDDSFQSSISRSDLTLSMWTSDKIRCLQMFAEVAIGI